MAYLFTNGFACWIYSLLFEYVGADSTPRTTLPTNLDPAATCRFLFAGSEFSPTNNRFALHFARGFAACLIQFGLASGDRARMFAGNFAGRTGEARGI